MGGIHSDTPLHGSIVDISWSRIGRRTHHKKIIELCHWDKEIYRPP